MNKKILIIDDDPKLNELLKQYLAKFNYQVICATDPYEAMRMIHYELPDAIILDVMLPHKDGFAVCQEIREKYSTPIIMLSARGEVTDKVIGLENGADDYLAKPFEPRELAARLGSILRRKSTGLEKEVLKSGAITVLPRSRSVQYQGKPLNLTNMEYEILCLFVRNPGVVFNRDQLLEKLSDEEWDTLNRSVDILVSRLRKKFNDNSKNPKLFKTVWGAGYMYIGDESK